MVPPFVIHKAAKGKFNIYEGHLKDAMYGTGIAISQRGWMKHELWYSWLEKMFIPMTKLRCKPNTRILLYYDGAA